MATIGQTLPTPESGTTRYDDSNMCISYNGTGWLVDNDGGEYNGHCHYTSTEGDSFSFNFTGQTLTLSGYGYPFTNSDISVIIDNGAPVKCSLYNASALYYFVYFSTRTLAPGIHTVTVVNNANSRVYIDTIDIDATGSLSAPELITKPTNLTASAGDSQVSLSWTAVTDAVGYNVKRSTTAGGPYTTITGNVSGATYVDGTVTNGTTYYYVVSTVTAAGESGNSNEAAATPNKAVTPPVSGGNVLLRIVMSDSSEREYALSKTDVTTFVSWYNRTVNTGNTCYTFTDSVDGSLEYLAFEKIISFKVLQLNK